MWASTTGEWSVAGADQAGVAAGINFPGRGKDSQRIDVLNK